MMHRQSASVVPSSSGLAWPFHPPGREAALDSVALSPNPDFAEAMLQALSGSPREIAPVFFYDDVGSTLFERICEQPEYYVTRTELGIITRHAADIARCIGPDAELIEFGAGASLKFRTLLPALQAPRRYVPIDVSGDHLRSQAKALRQDHPWLDVHPVEADFTQPFSVGRPAAGAGQRVGLYFGSSLGNFERQAALSFLHMAADVVGDGALLVGVDLVKDPAVLHAAYNDAAGVTAAFNLNLLTRANRELGCDFQTERFVHHACYHPQRQRVEMHLISTTRQTVHLQGRAFTFEEGESLHTENSHKFTLQGLRDMAALAGLRAGPVWMDPSRWFALQWLYRDGQRPLPWGDA